MSHSSVIIAISQVMCTTKSSFGQCTLCLSPCASRVLAYWFSHSKKRLPCSICPTNKLEVKPGIWLHTIFVASSRIPHRWGSFRLEKGHGGELPASHDKGQSSFDMVKGVIESVNTKPAALTLLLKQEWAAFKFFGQVRLVQPCQSRS